MHRAENEGAKSGDSVREKMFEINSCTMVSQWGLCMGDPQRNAQIQRKLNSRLSLFIFDTFQSLQLGPLAQRVVLQMRKPFRIPASVLRIPYIVMLSSSNNKIKLDQNPGEK